MGTAVIFGDGYWLQDQNGQCFPGFCASNFGPTIAIVDVINDVAICEPDYDIDGDVDAVDMTTFLEDFGRNSYVNPCPQCVLGNLCVYP